MTEWPGGERGDKPADFSDIADPLCEAFRFAYVLSRQNADQDIPYDGLDIGWRERACCFSAAEQLTVEKIGFSEDDQGRDALKVLVGLAIQLGIEQGRRITMSGPVVNSLKMQVLVSECEKTGNWEPLLEFLREE